MQSTDQPKHQGNAPSDIRRIYVEKKPHFDTAAADLLKDLGENLGITGLTGLRLVHRYDVSGITDDEYRAARRTIFSEAPVDHVHDETLPVDDTDTVIAIEYLPGQYDQRADSAAQCIQITTRKTKPDIKTARVIVLQTGAQQTLPPDQLQRIKTYLINPVDSREAALPKPGTLQMGFTTPQNVETLDGFTGLDDSGLETFRQTHGLAMSAADLAFCRNYFRDDEKRAPTITEIKMLDTYWSDHCRHTTFQTRITGVDFEDSPLTEPVRETYQRFLESHGDTDRDADICLMDIATMSMKELKARGKLSDLEVSGEVNACSIVRQVDIDGRSEEWLVMFKNETHNHPTEIEPFGGAATCLGGAIRDPLSGRSFVYQAMRVTGSGNPLAGIEETLAGKLPQRKITREAAHGYSSYGNQIGVPTGMVTEIYHDGYIAKRMEVGAVIGAVPRAQVVREEPVPGDIILLVGGRTGRDGIGGATGSSREHTEESLQSAGAEVQKGNPPEERKLQRLFRNPDVSRLIKKSNDFGAGGVSVAIGELADGLDINLDNVTKKYDGLDGTELALSESQERMAVVLSPDDIGRFKELADGENLEAVEIARVTESKRLRMHWRGQTVVDIGREFIDTHGVRQETTVTVTAPSADHDPFRELPFAVDPAPGSDLSGAWLKNLETLNTGSQKGLVERFDATVGGGTVLMPFGGRYQLTPIEAMAAKIPVFPGDSTTATLMAHGFDPLLSQWSPYHGGIYSVVEALCRVVATGGDYRTVRTSLQEYFEKLGTRPQRWGKPFSALLGAHHALTRMETAAIGGKDSMSGSFHHLDVPPTLITFAVDTVPVAHVISPEFKKAGNPVVILQLVRDQRQMPPFETLRRHCDRVTQLIKDGHILSARTVRRGGIAAALSAMAFGNHIGFCFRAPEDPTGLFSADYGSFLLEMNEKSDLESLFKGTHYRLLGHTLESPVIRFAPGAGTGDIPLADALKAWMSPLESVFPSHTPPAAAVPEHPLYTRRTPKRPAVKIARPRVIVPVFPGTNCEYETLTAFRRAGAEADTVVFRNLTPGHIEASLAQLAEAVSGAQIIAIPGGFSAGDEPEGSGKFIAAVFRNPHVRDAVMGLLHKRDGLMVGICNGFQALVKLGLLPHGEIRDIDESDPTLTFNRIGRHISCMVRTKVLSVLSPWFTGRNAGDIDVVPVSHGEGRFMADEHTLRRLMDTGQVATCYVDHDGRPAADTPHNPNGSLWAVEGITSPDGRVLGKMGHNERLGPNVARNIPGCGDQGLFEAGVAYFG